MYIIYIYIIYIYINWSALFDLNLAHEMVWLEWSTLHLDHLLQKSLRYKHHKESYIKSLNEGIVPIGFHLHKKLAFVPVVLDQTC